MKLRSTRTLSKSVDPKCFIKQIVHITNECCGVNLCSDLLNCLSNYTGPPKHNKYDRKAYNVVSQTYPLKSELKAQEMKYFIWHPILIVKKSDLLYCLHISLRTFCLTGHL